MSSKAITELFKSICHSLNNQYATNKFSQCKRKKLVYLAKEKLLSCKFPYHLFILRWTLLSNLQMFCEFTKSGSTQCFCFIYHTNWPDFSSNLDISSYKPTDMNRSYWILGWEWQDERIKPTPVWLIITHKMLAKSFTHEGQLCQATWLKYILSTKWNYFHLDKTLNVKHVQHEASC